MPVKLFLSEAIRLGAMLRPQCFGRTFADKKSCAMGAAYEAVAGMKTLPNYLPSIWSFLAERFPVLKISASCPQCSWTPIPVYLVDVIVHLNDSHHWTREQIAAYVSENFEQLEFPTAEESPAVDAEVCV
jgi:hypothetical protein